MVIPQGDADVVARHVLQLKSFVQGFRTISLAYCGCRRSRDDYTNNVNHGVDGGKLDVTYWFEVVGMARECKIIL